MIGERSTQPVQWYQQNHNKVCLRFPHDES